MIRTRMFYMINMNFKNVHVCCVTVYTRTVFCIPLFTIISVPGINSFYIYFFLIKQKYYMYVLVKVLFVGFSKVGFGYCIN